MAFRSPYQSPRCSGKDRAGFTLVELLLALSLSFGLCGAILQMLMHESQLGLRMNRLLRERGQQQRTLALIRQDIQAARRISADPLTEQHACNLTGRLPVLHLSTGSGTITYSVGAAPSSIWRGQVLMRCGPAFDLQGNLSGESQPQNRVVIDALAPKPDIWTGCGRLIEGAAVGGLTVDLASSSSRPFSACLKATGRLVGLRVVQDFAPAQESGKTQRVISELLTSPWT
jgi:hypothetical protein